MSDKDARAGGSGERPRQLAVATCQGGQRWAESMPGSEQCQGHRQLLTFSLPLDTFMVYHYQRRCLYILQQVYLLLQYLLASLLGYVRSNSAFKFYSHPVRSSR